MEDKPEEPTKIRNSQYFWKYAALLALVVIVLSLLIVCLLVFAIFFTPLREQTSKSETENVKKMSALLDNFLDVTNKLNETEYSARYQEILKKIGVFESSVFKELKTIVSKLETRRDDKGTQKTCDKEDASCIYHDNDLTKIVSNVEKQVASIGDDMKAKLAELQDHFDDNDYCQRRCTENTDHKKKNPSENGTKRVVEPVGYLRYILRTSMALVVFVTAELLMWKILTHIGRPPDAVEDVMFFGVLFNGVMAAIWVIYLMVLLLFYGRDAMVSVFGLLEASIFFSASVLGLVVLWAFAYQFGSMNKTGYGVFLILLLTVMVGDIYLTCVYTAYGNGPTSSLP